MQQRARQEAHAEQQQVRVEADGVPSEGGAVVEGAGHVAVDAQAEQPDRRLGELQLPLRDAERRAGLA